jgi:hypothetical protein
MGGMWESVDSVENGAERLKIVGSIERDEEMVSVFG